MIPPTEINIKQIRLCFIVLQKKLTRNEKRLMNINKIDIKRHLCEQINKFFIIFLLSKYLTKILILYIHGLFSMMSTVTKENNIACKPEQ